MITEKDVVKNQLHITGMVMSGKSWIFSLSNLEIFATNNSWLPDANDCHKGLHDRC